MKKLIKIGVGGNMLTWLHNFLTNRKQRVKIKDKISEADTVVSGVPQGTVLGPILFLIFVADIDEDLSFCHAASFADDTRVVYKIESQNDFNILQNDLNKIYTWAKVNM